MIIKRIKTEKIEKPDLVIQSDNRYKDILKIYKRKKEIVFSCEVYGPGNSWVIPLEEIRGLIK